MNAEKQMILYAACYSRLSVEDAQLGTSVSIETQQHVMEAYCVEHHITIYKQYSDDGYTGTNFDRPAFKQLIADAEARKFNVMIVKDLSRIGREYIGVGTYLESFFPDHGIRVIAIGDNYDSNVSNGDLDFLVPMKNLFNQFYPADTSRKVRQALVTKAKRGEFTSAAAPYGYIKDPSDKNKIIINEATAPVVRRIFDLAVNYGYGFLKIARTLRDDRIPKPSCTTKDGCLANAPPGVDPYDWNLCSVRMIIQNQVYMGDLVHGKREKVSYKSKKIRKNSSDKWIVAENSCPAIVSRTTWYEAQDRVKTRTLESKNGENIFAGLLFCDTCGKRLGLTSLVRYDGYYNCETYKKKGKDYCTKHYTRLTELYDAVLKNIQETIRRVRKYNKNFDETVAKAALEISQQQDDHSSRISEIESQIEKLVTKSRRLYEDRLDGIISLDIYMEISKAENEKIDQLKQELTRLKNIDTKTPEKKYAEFLEKAKAFGDIKELNSKILHTMIDKIIVSERVKVADGYKQKIEIRYKTLDSNSIFIKPKK